MSIKDDLGNENVRLTPADTSLPKRLLVTIATYVGLVLVSLVAAVGITVPVLAVGAFGTAVALGFAIAADRTPSLRPQAAQRVTLLAAFLLPLTTLKLREAPWVLLAVIVSAIAANLRFIPYHYLVAPATMALTVYLTSQGTGLVVLAVTMLGGVTVAAAITSRASGKPHPITPAETFGLVALITGFAVIEIARRSMLAGAQLPAARWGLFALVLVSIVLVSSTRTFASATKYAVPTVTALVALSMVLLPVQGVTEELRSSGQLDTTLSALSGNGSNAMTGEEGAGPRPQFKGVGFDGCDTFSIRDCLITHFDDMANRDGVQAAIDDVVKRVQGNVGTSFPTHCHQVVHNLGQLAYELTDGNFALVSSYDPQVCGTGFIHGLYERYFDRYGKLVFTDTGNICTKMNLVQEWYSWTCNHILGHTLMTKMMDNPAAATEFCLPLLESTNFADCASGAWMNFWADDSTLEWYRTNAMGDPEKVFGVCYGAETYSKFYCYQEIFPALTTISNNDLPKMARWCRDYSEQPRGSGAIFGQSALFYAERCMQGVARVIAVASGYDYRVAMLRCVDLDPDQADTCLAGAGASITLNTGSVTAGLEMCERVKETSYREFCFVWVKQTGLTLRSGPNSQNMPTFGEIRIPDVEINRPLPPKTTEGGKATKG
jgi:hypothetical protein